MRPGFQNLILAPALLLSGPVPLSAQTILVQVTQAETGLAIHGAFLSLYRENGSLVRHTLSNAQGRFILTPGKAGSYRVRAQMIGRESLEREGVMVGPGEVAEVRLKLNFHPIPLRGIEVEAEERCRVLPEEASALSVAWEEAKKALTVQEWTEGAEMFRFQVVNYERDMDLEDPHLGRETRQVLSGVSNNPIRSLPVGELLEKGFVQREGGGGWVFWAPDAAVLLSNEFLDTHCFHLRSDPNQPGALGLAFEPFQATERTDIRGTLWLDRETAALRFLDYVYVWDEYPKAQGVARGRVDFEGLPGGAWITRKWWIRMPRLSLLQSLGQAGRSGVYVSGIRESGGMVDRISTLDGRRVDRMETGGVEGVVWDSTETRPLVGAEVYLSGTSHSMVTDAEGRFRLENVPEGNYLVAFAHPKLDAMGVFSRGVDLELTPDTVSRAALSIPSLQSISEQTCPAEEREMGPGFLTGVVREESSGRPIPDAQVNFRWDKAGLGGIVLVQTRTDAEGRYTRCGLPVFGIIGLRARYMDWESNRRSVVIPHETYPVLDLEIDVKGVIHYPFRLDTNRPRRSGPRLFSPG